MSPLTTRLARAAAAAVLGLGLAVSVATGTGGASTPHYDHNSPTHDWGGYTCADDARVFHSAYVSSTGSSHAHMGSVQLLYSPRCQTYWAQVFHYTTTSNWPHYWFSAAVADGDGRDIYCQYAEPDGFTGGGCYTAMLSEPEQPCVAAKGAMFYGSNQNLVAFGETETTPEHCVGPGFGVGGKK